MFLSVRLRRDRAEGAERSEAVFPADDGQQVSLGGADHPDGGLLGRGPRREARLRPHQDLHGQTQQVRPPRFTSFLKPGPIVALRVIRFFLFLQFAFSDPF